MKQLKAFLYPHLQRLRRLPLLFWFCVGRLRRKTELKQVLLFSGEREALTGNLRFVSDALAALKPEYKQRILLKSNMPPTRELADFFARSSTIFIDEFEPCVYTLPFGKDQRLVQVWHAMGAFKKVGFARENAVKTSLSHKNYTHVAVSAESVRSCYAQSFGIAENKVYAWGIPRTDAFFDMAYREKKQGELLEQYPILKEKKLLLFAPTFRGENRNDGYYPAEYLDIPALYEALRADYVLGIKLHPLIQNTLDIPPQCRDFVLDLTAHREVNDLLFSAAVLVTDYSSVIFENALLGTPAVFYVPDYEEYAVGRGFYFPFDSYVYGAKVQTTQALIDAVHEAFVDEKKLAAFRRQFIENCDGHASERMVKMLF